MEATRAERYRVREIEATARQMNMPGDMLAAAIEDGTTLADFQRQALDYQVPTLAPPRASACCSLSGAVANGNTA